MKRVVCAAVKLKDGVVIVGIRHFSPDMHSTLKRIYGAQYKFKIAEQGFVDTHGNFLTREEAWKHAVANN